ncbi:gastrula zinc finger protein XlCGF57.1 [Plutella xylostella]|nr:gastrula zinc finger protein XlCGF57.1 [Plutella xylostella]
METLCRICGEQPGTTHIFSSPTGSKLSEMLMYICVNIKINESDGLPEHVCNICEQESKSAYQFVRKCEDSDKRLRSKYINSLKQECAGNNEEQEVKDEPGDSPRHYHDEVCEDDSIEDLKPLLTDLGNIKEPTNSKHWDHVNIPIEFSKEHKKESYPCQNCDHTFRYKYKLNIHKMKCHGEKKPYSCESCEKAYTTRGSLKKHQLLRHCAEPRKRDYICEACGKAFYSKNGIKIHMRTHTGEAPHACSICPKKFKQISTLKKHEQYHSEQKPYSCSECGKAFKTRDSLSGHLLVHSADKNFTCPVCKSTFKFKNSLRAHLVLHSGIKGFVCDHCGRAFYTKGNLKMHIDKQHSEKSGQCAVCKKHVPDLQEHMKKHSGEKSFKCKLCDSSFGTLNGLSHHTNFRHKNTDRFKCSYEGCGKTFPSAPMVQFHEAKLHGGGAPLACARCARPFYRRNDLARHMIGTHKERLSNNK